MRFVVVWVSVVMALFVAAAYGHTGGSVVSSSRSDQAIPATARAPSAAPALGTAYSSERRAKAIAYSHAQYALYFVGTLVSLAIYFLLWISGVSGLFRDWACRASRRRALQCLIFVLLFLAVASLLNLPLDYYGGFMLEHRFGLSTQGLVSWVGDWAKSLAVTVALGTIGAGIFYTLVRRTPRRWWFYFWLASIPLVLAFLLVEPFVIEPLFSKFTPLAKTQPALVERIEAMLNHAGLSIPPARVLEMDASSKTKTVDAYVSGLGASKRVVVWDTALRTMGTDELLLVLGHETGHYVLDHIPKEFTADEAVALVFSFLGFLALNRLLERMRSHAKIDGVSDLASFPFVLIVLTLLVFFSAPLVNGISRHYEHQADQFGLEVAYGIVPDPNAAEVRSLEILGDQDLADPDPNPFIKFWLYTHPPLEERIRFAASYKPWAEGKPLELLHR